MLTRLSIVANDDQLRMLYDELVSTNIVTDEEFWQMRTDEMKRMSMRGRSQQRGVSTSASFEIEPTARYCSLATFDKCCFSCCKFVRRACW